MRRFVVVASMIASGIGCVNLDKPEQVAECATKGTCANGKSDAALPDALSGKGNDADSRVDLGGSSQDDSSAGNGDGPTADEPGATTFDGGSLLLDTQGPAFVDGGQNDAPIGGADGPEGSRDVTAPDVPSGACSAVGLPKPAGTICRVAIDLCDVPEVCDGVSSECPVDKPAAAATPCRPVAGDCDIAETCDGTGTACPLDGFKAAGTVCRLVAGVCDVAESCDGASAACPLDSFAPSTTVCHDSTDSNACDPAEKCMGTGVVCPADVTYVRPAAPTGVTAVPGTLQITVSWTSSAQATGYNVKQSLDGKGYTTLISSPTTTASPFTDTGLAGNTLYSYKVSAINTISSCQSDDSLQTSATTSGSCVAPAAPVVTAAAANGSVTLTWAAVTAAVSYTVARSQTMGTGYATVGTVKTGTTFTDGNVVNGIAYYYVVTASNGICSSGNSNEALISPACTPPSAPTGVTASAGNGSVTLKWTASTGAVSYSVYRNTTGTDPFPFVNSTTQLTFTDSNVVNDTKYYYVVRASNGSCASGNSLVVPVTPACVPPAAPTGIVVTAGDKQLGLSWTAPKGATQYRVSQNTAATGTFTQVATPTTTNYTDKPLSNGTTYYYVVAASNGSCWSTDSAVASGTPVCTPPPIPGVLVATPGAGQVSLSWGASRGATVYAIWRKPGPTGTAYEQIGTATVTTYTDLTASNGTTYTYKITAGNGSCNSDYDAEQSATPAPLCAQTEPTNVKAMPSGSVQVTVTWTAATPQPATYSIARSETSGTGYTSIDNVAGTVLTYTDTDVALVKNKTYYYQVIANGTCTAASAESPATTACATPAVPAPTVSNAKGALTVAWTAIDGATAYTVSRSDAVAGAYLPVSADQTAATFTDLATALTNGSTYYYKVTASNAAGQCVSVASTPVSAMSCAAADVPVGITKTVGTSGQVKLSWTASTGATLYTILRSTTSGAEVAIGTSATNSYTDATVTDWTTYYYKVSAQNGSGNACSSAASSEVAATPNACPVLPGSTNAYPPGNIGTGAYCFTTCWDLQSSPPVYGGLQANNYGGRTLTINGTSVSCPANGQCTIPTLTKDRSTYPINGAYVVRVSAGSSPSASNNWWGNSAAHDCQ